MKRLSSLGLGPKLLATFANGRFEEYIDAAPCTAADLRNPTISRAIAAKICELHLATSDIPPPRKPELFDTISGYFKRTGAALDAIWETYPERRDDQLLNRVRAIYAKYKVIGEAAESPVVFCHCDTQYGNILRRRRGRQSSFSSPSSLAKVAVPAQAATPLQQQPHEQKIPTNRLYELMPPTPPSPSELSEADIMLVDYEYSGFGYRGFDIANHFIEWTADYHAADGNPHKLRPEAFPSREQRRVFYKSYLRRWRLSAGSASPCIDSKLASSIVGEGREMVLRNTANSEFYPGVKPGSGVLLHNDNNGGFSCISSTESSSTAAISLSSPAPLEIAACCSEEAADEKGGLKMKSLPSVFPHHHKSRLASKSGNCGVINISCKYGNTDDDDGSDSDTVDEQEREASLEREVGVFIPASHLLWGLWGIVREADMLGRREIDFDYWEYAITRISAFETSASKIIDSVEHLNNIAQPSKTMEAAAAASLAPVSSLFDYKRVVLQFK